MVRWIAESLRPFSIVEDEGFKEFSEFLCNVNGRFVIPSRYKLRKYLSKISSLTTRKMREMMKKDMRYFSASTDIWSSRRMDSFMALTLQYATDEFKMVNLTLEVSQLHGRHTGNFIKDELIKYFDLWGIHKENLVLMTRDNGSNVVKACRDWGNQYFGCIGHCLHLIVRPLFIMRDDEAESLIDSNAVADDIVDYDMQEIIDISQRRVQSEAAIATKITVTIYL